MKKGIIFLQLNEINFDLVKQYIEQYDDLPNFKRLVTEYYSLETFGEDEYELLEPWIQWVSIHTGKSFSDHGVFRLGDVVNMADDCIQLLEDFENEGLRVGAISPMNARNCLKNPAYFIPDPWTNTPSDGSAFSERITNMLRQTVNDNASGSISTRSIFTLIEAAVKAFHPKRTASLLRLIAASFRKPWLKATVLDSLIHSLHLYLLSKTKPDVSFVFLNSGAHIQHHYLLNSEWCKSDELKNPDWYVKANQDPVRDMLKVYDGILEDYLNLASSGFGLMVATGLTQIPYDRVKFYYRLSNHRDFLDKLGMCYLDVLPRMTRDFEITFSSSSEAVIAADVLKKVYLKRTNLPVFKEIDIRARSLFVTLTYPNEILKGDSILTKERVLGNFDEDVTFVAIKNGKHSTKGFAYFSDDIKGLVDESPIHVSRLYELSKKVAEKVSSL